jgi:hypothetical protein
MEIVAAFWLFTSVATLVVAARNGRNALGWFFLGSIFGIFALILVLVLGPPDHPASSLTGQLEELRDLQERGVITGDEYDRKKASLLS